MTRTTHIIIGSVLGLSAVAIVGAFLLLAYTLRADAQATPGEKTIHLDLTDQRADMVLQALRNVGAKDEPSAEILSDTFRDVSAQISTQMTARKAAADIAVKAKTPAEPEATPAPKK